MTVQLPRSPFLARHFSEYATTQASAQGGRDFPQEPSDADCLPVTRAESRWRS